MSAIQILLTDHLDIWTAADIEKKSGRGRSSGNVASVHGIKKLRELILELAVRGKLVPQDSKDEPASELFKRVQTEKAKLIAEGKFKKEKLLTPLSEEEKPYELPDGWGWVRLGEITNFGVTEKLDSISDETWVLDLEDIEKDTSKLLQKFNFAERNSLSAKNSFRAGDVLYGKLRPYLNKVIVADEAGVCTTEILPVRCYGEFSSDYFKFALKSPHFVNYVNARSYGMKMPRLGKEDGRKASFPLPPLAEQHRIVFKVDELMTLCDQLETQHKNATEAHKKLVRQLLGTLIQSQSAADFDANWQRIATHFDTLFTTEASIDALKQTLLQLAVMGKLTPKDPKDEPASGLLERIRAEKATLFGEGKIKKDKPIEPITDEEKAFELPDGWEWVKCQDICLKITDGEHATPTRSKSGCYLLSARNVTNEGIVLNDVDYVPLDEFKRIRNRCDPNIGDILISCSGSVGRVALVDKDSAYSMVRSAAMIRPNPNWVLKEYIALMLRSTYVQSQMTLRSKQSAQANLFLGAICNLVLILPPLAEQHHIVAKVDELMALCDQVKSHLTDANQLQQKLADVMVGQAVA